MIVTGFADIHDDLAAIRAAKKIMEKADLVILGGDITNFRDADAASVVLDEVMQAEKPVLAVSGNCDLRGVDEFLSARGINIHAGSQIIDGIGFLGLGGSLVTPFHTPNEYTEEELEAALDAGFQSLPGEDTPFVLVSHQPPVNTACDIIGGGRHVGSLAVRRFIEKRKPLACITGHIHESSATDRIMETPVINPGRLGDGGYAWIEINGTQVISEIRKL